MRYKVPRHIEHKAKIVGGATFQQVLFIAGAAMMIFVMYFTVRYISMTIFLFLSMLVGGAGIALAFIKVGDQPLPDYIKKFVFFSTSSKNYVWKKKDIPFTTINRKTSPPKIKKEDEDNENKKPSGKSKLRESSTKLETL